MQKGASGILNENYFRWMVSLIHNSKYMNKDRHWMKLFRLLHEREFIYILEMDGNRADDGVELRYRYGWEKGFVEEQIEQSLDIRPCSLLEMMVALAHRCEESIMDNSEEDRTGVWFFEMIESLGLIGQDDEHFRPRIVNDILDDFIHRNYKPDGKGSLFTIKSPGPDMRKMEIWYQMNRYLIEHERR